MSETSASWDADGLADLGAARAAKASRCAHPRPERVLADAWGRKPERAGKGCKTGMSAAIWGSRATTTTEYKRPAFDHFHVLTVRLQDFRAERWQDGRLVRERDTRPGCSALTFPGVAARSVIYGCWRSLQIYLPTGLLVETAEQADLMPLAPERLESGLSYDAQLHMIAASLAAEIEHRNPGSSLQIDSLGTMLCVHLLRKTGADTSAGGRARGGLARWQVKRAMEAIADRLEENLTLSDLAEEVGLSQYHFARAFKQSTGLSPHRYLLHCRLERAKELLAGTEASVADIAARVGYNEATQLSRLFQTELATSPSAYRRMTAPRYAER